MAKKRLQKKLALPELDAIAAMNAKTNEKTDLLVDLNQQLLDITTKSIQGKQAKEQPQTDLHSPKLDALVELNEDLLDVTAQDVVGGIEELTSLFKEGIPVTEPTGGFDGEISNDSLDEMLKSIQSIEQGSGFTKEPEFLQFMEEQNESARDLIKGTEEERVIGFAMLDSLDLLRLDNKESVEALRKQQEKADKKSFKDAAKSALGKIPGFGSIKGIGIEAALEGALIAGIAGWQVGTVLEGWMNDNWQIRDKFASAMDAIVETFPSASEWLGLASTELELGKQVFTPEERAGSIRVQSRVELEKEKKAQLARVQARTDLSEEARAQITKRLEEDIKRLNQELADLFKIDPNIVVEDTGEVLSKQKEIGRRERAQNISKGLNNKANDEFRQEVLRDRKGVVVKPQTTVIPIPAQAPVRPSPQKQIDDFGMPIMHQFNQ